MLLAISIALLMAGIAIGWFAAQRGMPDLAKDATRGGLSIAPALEQDATAEEVLRMAGFDHGFVYRWHGGLLDGYVLLDTPGGPQRMALDTGKFAQEANQFLVFQAGERNGGEARLDPTQVRGVITIGIRPKAPGVAGRECLVNIRATVHRAGKSASAGTAVSSGQLPEFTSFSGGTAPGKAFEKLTLADGGTRDLFDLRLRER